MSDPLFPTPQNAFDPDFLARLGARDDPPGALEAEMDGEWFVESLSSGGYALYRSWQSRENGHRPAALFTRLEDALLAAAIRPAVGRDPLFFQETEPTADGYYLVRTLSDPERPHAVIGALAHLEDPMIAAPEPRRLARAAPARARPDPRSGRSDGDSDDRGDPSLSVGCRRLRNAAASRYLEILNRNSKF